LADPLSGIDEKELLRVVDCEALVGNDQQDEGVGPARGNPAFHELLDRAKALLCEFLNDP